MFTRQIHNVDSALDYVAVPFGIVAIAVVLVAGATHLRTEDSSVICSCSEPSINFTPD